ncbi:MAG: hypothetical protein ACSHX9_08060 [Luteolibacter sp.]
MNLVQSALEAIEGDSFWDDTLSLAMLDFLSRGAGILANFEKLVEGHKEGGPIIDERRFYILSCYERFLHTVGRFPCRSELLKMVETKEGRSHGTLDMGQNRNEIKGLGLTLAKHDNVQKFMRWLMDQETSTVSDSELLDKWVDWPQGYVPMAFRCPDLICHNFYRMDFGSDWKDDIDTKSDELSPALGFTLADIGQKYAEASRHMPTEFGRQLLEEKARLIKFTYEEPEVCDDLPPWPRKLTAKAANWPTDPNRKKSVVAELNLKIIAFTLQSEDERNLRRMQRYEKWKASLVDS